MHRSKSACAASFVLLLSVAAACGGQLVEDVDDRVKMSATNATLADASVEAPGALPCMPGTAEGVACGAAEHRCTDDGLCSAPRYLCRGGTWHLESETTCASQKKSSCPARMPSEQDWCPEPDAKCTYPDTCSERPSSVLKVRTYQCSFSRWMWTSARYDVTCPKSAPANGDACEPSCGFDACVYDDACGSGVYACEPKSATWRRTDGTSCTDAGSD